MEEEINYDHTFQTEFGTEATTEDIDYIRNKLLHRAEARSGRVGNGESLEAAVEGVRRVYREQHGVEMPHSDLQDIFGDLKEQKRKQDQALRNKQRDEAFARAEKSRRWKRFNRIIAATGLLGIGVGTAVTAYDVLHTPAVETVINHYDAKEAELNNKFFGPLDSLTEISTTSTLSPSHRELYLQNELRKDLGDQLATEDNTIYDQTVGETRIVAKTLSEYKESDQRLLVLKMEPAGGILEAHYFDTEHYIIQDTDTTEEYLDRAEPYISVIFSGDEMKVIDFQNESVREVVNNRTKYQSGDTEQYQDYIKDILTEFKDLYKRGPNPQ